MGSPTYPLLHGLIFQGIITGTTSIGRNSRRGALPSSTSKLQIPRLRLRSRQNGFVLLHLAALAARKVLHPASRGFERIMNHQLKIGMRRLGWYMARSSGFSNHWSPVDHYRLALDYNFLARQCQVDANVKGFALLVMAMRDLNGDATPGDAMVERFEFLGLCPNPVFYFGGMFHVAKCDLQRKRHGRLPCVSSFHKLQKDFPVPCSEFILTENPHSDVTGVTFGSDFTHCATIWMSPKLREEFDVR